jgi:hypothetical protein
MTGLALEYGVSANQRESVLVVLNGWQRNCPALLAVAFFASPAKLPAVNIRVAI